MTIGSIAQIIVVMLLWAVCFPLITAGIEYSPHLTFAALRALLAGAVLTLCALVLRRPFPKEPRIWATLAIVGLGATSLGYLGMFHAAEFVSPGTATVIANTQPLLAAVLASIVLGERLTLQGKCGLALGFAGIVVLTSPQIFDGRQENYILGVAYIVLAALGITISNVLIKRISSNVDGLMAMGLQMLLGSLPLVAGAWVLEEPRNLRWTPEFIAVFLTLSLFGSALVYWMWFSVLKSVSLNRANAFSFLIPIFGIAMGMAFYGETLNWTDIAGVFLAILGVGLVVRRGAVFRKDLD